MQSLVQNNAILKCDPKDAPVQPKDNVMLLLNVPGRQYSVATRIDAITTEAGSQPTIVVDKRILDLISPGDSVDIYKYGVPFAEKINIALPHTTRIFDGDWTPNVRQPLEGKVIDYGNSVALLVPFESGPITITGKIATTIPKCPVCVGPQTKVWLKKYKPQELDAIVVGGQREKEQRARILFEELKAKSLEGVAALKSDVTAFVGDNYPFKETEPKAIFQSLLGIFTGYKPLEPPHESDTRDSYVAYATFVCQDGITIKNVMEAHVIATGHSGNVQVGVYSRNPTDSRAMLDILYKKIEGLKFGLRQRAESAESKCPNCGADLPLEEADAEGMVKCSSCKKRAILPKRLRH